MVGVGLVLVLGEVGFPPGLVDSLGVLRAERRGAAGAVAETGSGGGHGPPARAARRRRAALIQ